MNCSAQKVPQGEGGLSSTQPVFGICHMHAVYQSVLLPSIMVSLIAIFPSRQVWDVPARAFVPIFVSIRMEPVSFVARLGELGPESLDTCQQEQGRL